MDPFADYDCPSDNGGGVGSKRTLDKNSRDPFSDWSDEETGPRSKVTRPAGGKAKDSDDDDDFLPSDDSDDDEPLSMMLGGGLKIEKKKSAGCALQ